MGILLWIIFGAIVGWAGFRLAGEEGQGCLTNMVIGIGGAMLGGSVLAILTGRDLLFPSNAVDVLLSFVASTIGAAVLILLLRMLGRRA